MPATIRGAVSIGTLPFSLSTQFSEAHAVQVNINEYHDGQSQRKSLVTGDRRTWKIAKKLDPVNMALLRTFWEEARGGAFFFYNPSETEPPYSQAPAGTLGRYTVRFNSDWSQTNGLRRSDTSIELVELATAQDIGEG